MCLYDLREGCSPAHTWQAAANCQSAEIGALAFHEGCDISSSRLFCAHGRDVHVLDLRKLSAVTDGKAQHAAASTSQHDNASLSKWELSSIAQLGGSKDDVSAIAVHHSGKYAVTADDFGEVLPDAAVSVARLSTLKHAVATIHTPVSRHWRAVSAHRDSFLQTLESVAPGRARPSPSRAGSSVECTRLIGLALLWLLKLSVCRRACLS